MEKSAPVWTFSLVPVHHFTGHGKEFINRELGACRLGRETKIALIGLLLEGAGQVPELALPEHARRAPSKE